MKYDLSLIGKKFGRLTITGYSKDNKHGFAMVNCLCDCGKNITTRKSYLTRTKKPVRKCKSCCGRDNMTTHGMKNTKEYRSWCDMKARCFNKNNTAYKNYGKRGITVCEEWINSFETFYKDMGPVPSNFTLERLDVNDIYKPSNCIWASNKTQANNTRRNTFLTYQNKTKTISQWADEYNLKYSILYERLFKLNWSISKALNTPKLK